MNLQMGEVRRRRGIALVWAAISMVLIFAFAALAIDLALLWSTDAAAQGVAEAAALAAAAGLSDLDPNRPWQLAQEYAGKNQLHGQAVVLQQAEDFELGRWDPVTRTLGPVPAGELPDAVKVTTRLTAARGNPVGLTFGRMLGSDSADVVDSAVAQFGTAQTWDLVIVQDVSPSFKDAIDLAADADEALLGCLADHVGNESQIGFVVFAGTAVDVVPMQPIETGYNTLLTAIQAVEQCCWPFAWADPWWVFYTLHPYCSEPQIPTPWPQCQTATHIAVGIDAAAAMFAAASSDPDIGKAIIIVSDGRPEGSNPTYEPPLVTDMSTTAERLAMGVAAADSAAALGISIFTIYYSGVSDDPVADALYLESLTRGEGTFQETPDPVELETMMWRVCATLPLRLVD